MAPSKTPALCGGYYNMNAFLAGEERIESEFLINAFDIGHLDPSRDDAEEVLRGERIVLPLWLAQVLSSHHHVRLLLPTFLRKAYRHHIRAGASNINLREQCVYFYAVASALASHLPANAQISSVVAQALGGKRYQSIMDQSMNSYQSDTTEFKRKLTDVEIQLFNTGRKSGIESYEWKSRSSFTLKRAPVSNAPGSRKRKCIN